MLDNILGRIRQQLPVKEIPSTDNLTPYVSGVVLGEVRSGCLCRRPVVTEGVDGLERYLFIGDGGRKAVDLLTDSGVVPVIIRVVEAPGMKRVDFQFEQASYWDPRIVVRRRAV